ncbi:MAG: phosphatase family protein [Ilumatobacteraceae bacterium]|nr:phosphatase family protein [Ilumatobacteraceae bacterium]
MPIVIALLLAAGVTGCVFGLAARRGRGSDLADVRADGSTVGEDTLRRHPRLERFLLERRDPTKETGLLLTVAVAAVAVGIVLIGGVLEMVSTHQGFARIDDAAARFGARHATPDSTNVLKVVTTLGGTWFVIVVGVVVGAHQYWRHRSVAPTLFLTAAISSTVLVGNLVKLIVHRSRPDIARLVGAAGSSFPSGHSAAAAATYASLALIYGRHRSRRAKSVLAGVAAALAFMVAASRVLLGVHWLTDVIAGVLLGWTCFALCSIAFGGRIMHFGQPVETAQAVAVDVEAQHPPNPHPAESRR